MVVKKAIVFWLIFFGITYSVLSQSYYPVLDQSPAKIKWKKIQISNSPFSIVYNQASDSLAQLTANYVQNNYLEVAKGLNVQARPWNIILQNKGVISNGFVSLQAPRVELFTTKPQNSSLLSINHWHELLASHELRHVYQMELSRRGLGKWGQWLFGNSFLAGVSTLYIPNWLFEGDAVETETRMNPSGRSKIPQFYVPLFAYLSEYGLPSYGKMMAKSYRELVPNHYVFGQTLSKSFLTRYGEGAVDQLWKGTFASMKPMAFSRSVKKLSGKNIDDYTKELLNKLRDSAQVYALQNQDNPILRSTPIKKGFTQYEYPQWTGYESFVAIKSGLGDIPKLVKFKGPVEFELLKLGPKADDGMLSANKDFVVLSELTFHARWGQKQGSRILIFDLKNHRKKYWDIGLKWMSPSISPDSQYLSLIQQNDDGSSEIIVFDFNTQEIINSFPMGINEMAVQPRISNSNQLVFIHQKENRKKIIVWDWKKNTLINQIDLGQNNASSPFLSEGKVFFNLPDNGLDQLFAWNMETNHVSKLTNSTWGAYHPSVNEIGQRMLYSSYTAKGLQIVEKKLLLDSLPVIQLTVEPYVHQKDTTQFRTYSSKKFRQWLNVYSWGPLASAQNNQLEVSIASKNILNTLQLGGGLLFNANERNWSQFAKFSLQKWYPIFDLSIVRSNRSTSLYIDRKTPLDSLRTDNWVQNKLDFGLRLPFNLTHSAYQENLTLINNYSFMQIQGYQLPARYSSQAFDGTYFSTINQVNYYKLLNKSALDVQSRKGLSLNFYWQSMPKKQSIRAELWSIQTRIFLPGIGKHDGILLRYGYQQQMRGNYFFASPLQIPRGDLYQNFSEYHSYSVEYKFPIANTDFNLGKLMYFKRLKGNLFLDQGVGVNRNNQSSKITNFQSLGIDLLSQVSFLRFSQTIEVGIRCLYKSPTNNFEFFPLLLEIGF